MIDFYAICNFSDIVEFHNILPIENMESVIKHGILSFYKAVSIKHENISMQEVQGKRDKKKIGEQQLHSYANLYFHARNPMMSARRNEDICVLRVSVSVIERPGVVFSDRNAASDWARIYHKQEVENLDFPIIYCKDWRDPIKQRYFEKKSKKCAEILVPDSIPYEYVIGAYVKSKEDKYRLQAIGFDKELIVNKEIFLLEE